MNGGFGDAVGQSLRPVISYVCIAGEASNDRARCNAMIPQAGLAVLRPTAMIIGLTRCCLALAELAHHYGLCKLPAEREPPQRDGSLQL